MFVELFRLSFEYYIRLHSYIVYLIYQSRAQPRKIQPQHCTTRRNKSHCSRDTTDLATSLNSNDPLRKKKKKCFRGVQFVSSGNKQAHIAASRTRPTTLGVQSPGGVSPLSSTGSSRFAKQKPSRCYILTLYLF